MTEAFAIPELEPGIYRHYKGNTYTVLGVGRHTEADEYFVAYSPVEQKPGVPSIWLRPFDMFIEKVEVDGETTSRFQRIEGESVIDKSRNAEEPDAIS